ncbi:MAG: leucine-rich repeat protein [Roseburia sp.]|nr:leucine-rich repeat protein [Roseburia sp.]
MRRTNRKAVVFLLTGMLFAAGMSIPAKAGEINTIGEENVEESELYATNTPTLTDGVLTGCQSYNKNGGVVDLSDGWEGQTITEIGANCFNDNDNITKVILPATVTNIGNYAFAYCNSLKTVEFVGTSQLSYIGNEAFRQSDLSQFEMPDSVVTIGTSAFLGTDISSITIPKGCTNVGTSAFQSCSNLLSVKILNPTLETVGNYAFSNCSKAIIYGEPSNKKIATDNGRTFQRFTKSLTVTQMPTKAFYYTTDSSTLDKRGLIITAEYASATAPTSEGLDLSDCTFSEFSTKSAGTKTVTVSYGGAETSFNVNVYYDFSRVSVGYQNSKDSYGMDYTGQECKPAFVLKYDGLTLGEGVDYRTEYSQDVVNAGTVTVKFIGTAQAGGYHGEKETTYKILPKSLTDDDVAVKLSQESYAYTGSPVEPTVTVTVGTAELVKDRDYRLEYKNNTGIGQGTATVIGIGNCNGTREVNFNIVRADISKAAIASIPTQKWTGRAITPSVKVTYEGKTLKKGTDYTVAYKSNKNPGKGKVTITGMGYYTGTKTAKFTIAKKHAVGTKLTSGSLSYQVTASGKVKCTGLSKKNAGKISIPATITKDETVYKVTEVSKNAFKNTGITQATIGANVAAIKAGAFEGCKKLTKVTVGKGVTKIEANAWKDCKKLKSIEIKTTKLKTVGKNVFKGIHENATIKVPAKKLSAYKKLLKSKGQGKKVKIKAK